MSGQEKIGVQGFELKAYQTKSHLIHGHTVGNSYTPTYSSWQCMLARCRYQKRDKKNKHVGRGIGVCERWNKFNFFLEDMGERPKGESLDRINNDGNYEPNNCRWASSIEQARNRRNTKFTFETALDAALRIMSGETAKSVAADYDCSESLPREIAKGRTWKDAHKQALKIIGDENE